MQHRKGLWYAVSVQSSFSLGAEDPNDEQSNRMSVVFFFFFSLFFPRVWTFVLSWVFFFFLPLTLFDRTFSSLYRCLFYFLQSKSGMFQLEFLSNDENSLEIRKTLPYLHAFRVGQFLYFYFFVLWKINRHFPSATSGTPKKPQKIMSVFLFFLFFSVLCVYGVGHYVQSLHG